MPIADPRQTVAPADPGVTPWGRLRDPSITSSDRNIVIAMHLLPMVGLVTSMIPIAAIPLILWLVRRNESSFVDDQGREVLNMIITSLIVGLLCVTLVFIPFAIIWSIVMFINTIRGAVVASSGEYFRYPMIIRFMN